MIVTTLTRELRTAERSAALRFIRGERKKETDALGFIPWAGVERHDELGRLAVCSRDGDLVGFVLFGGSRETERVFQLAVRRDARRIEHGRALVAVVENQATQLRRGVLTARVAADLPAVAFWEALGFKAHEIGPGGNRRGRMVVTFRKLLSPRDQSPRAPAPPPRGVTQSPTPHTSCPPAAREAKTGR